jgi:hypothetical protein
MTTHVEIDLETLGTVPGSVILSIGAVKFDPARPYKDCVTEKFYCVVDQASCVARGMTISQDTLAWWKKQSPEARKVLAQSEDPEQADGLFDALTMLTEFIGKGAKIWSNGANFDQPLLAVAYDKCDMKLPWAYWDGMCHRTVVSLHKGEKALRDPDSGAHNALDDAEWQAKHLVKIASILKIKL